MDDEDDSILISSSSPSPALNNPRRTRSPSRNGGPVTGFLLPPPAAQSNFKGKGRQKHSAQDDAIPVFSDDEDEDEPSFPNWTRSQPGGSQSRPQRPISSCTGLQGSTRRLAPFPMDTFEARDSVKSKAGWLNGPSDDMVMDYNESSVPKPKGSRTK